MMREVQAKIWNPETKTHEPRQAVFHAWAQEADGEGQSNPVAIVELEDGQIATVYAPFVRFTTAP
jgi:hypothetical protein